MKVASSSLHIVGLIGGGLMDMDIAASVPSVANYIVGKGLFQRSDLVRRGGLKGILGRRFLLWEI